MGQVQPRPRVKRYVCPLCGSPLKKHKWLEVTNSWEANEQLLEEAKQREQNAYARGTADNQKKNRYLVSRVAGLTDWKKKATETIRELRRQVKRGTNPQLEGLLYEEELCNQLQTAFRDDKVTHHGKGGDVLHEVRLNQRKVGVLVFECKRVESLKREHVEQTRRAKVQRQADFAILVTSARDAHRAGIWQEQDVVVVHPAAVLVLVHQFRETLVRAARSRMTRVARERAIRAILAFVDSSEFRNPLRDIVRRAELLGEELVRERDAHYRLWRDRWAHYAAIWNDGLRIGQEFDRILEQHSVHAPHGKLTPQASEGKAIYPVRKEALLLPAAKD